MKKINKLILIAILAFSVIILKTSSILAAPIYNEPVELKQFDGQVIKCFVSGDEYTHYFHDEESYIIMKDSQGRYVYAENHNGIPVPSSILVNSVFKKPLNLAKLSDIKISEDFINKKKENKNSDKKSIKSIQSGELTKGTINNLVIFIKFKDDTNFSTKLDYYAGQFNDNTISMKNYFKETSYNKLTISSTFYPKTSNNTIISYTDANPRSYYEPYDWDNPNGYLNDKDSYVREQTLLRNALLYISAQVPKSLNLDNNSDGLIDSLVFVVKGNSEQWGNLLWPHNWYFSPSYADDIYINGKQAYNYDIHLEDFIKSKGIGVLCHEMFHSLGAPDLYHYNEIYSNLTPVGKWDIMESTTRQYMSAYMKYRYGKWIDDIPEIGKGTYTLNPLSSSTNNVYKIKISGNDKEFFILEYRKKAGNYESQLPGSGLLIYRINTSEDGNGNTEGPPDEIYLFRPGGTTNSNGEIDEANLSNIIGRSTTENVINLFDSSNRAVNLIIKNVVENSSNISFTVDVPDPVLESSHPYKYNEEKKWTVSAPNMVQRISLTFDSYTEVENGYDFIYILDSKGKNINGSPFTGTTLAGKTITINGNKATILLKSDNIVNKYGFKVTKIKYDYPYTGSFQNNVQGNNLKISGFGIYKAAISRFDIYIDNVLYGIGTRSANSSLSKTYPYTDISKAGFSYTIDTRKLKNGNHKISVIARGSDGTSYSFGTKTISINNK